MTVLAFANKSDTHPAGGAPLSEDGLASFGDAIVKVTSYCTAVSATNLAPAPEAKQPDWYAALNASLITIKCHAQTWVDTVGPSMTAIPQAIINFDNDFEGQYDTIIALLNAIGTSTPTNKQKDDLMTEMDNLLSSLEKHNAAIGAANKSLIDFNDKLSSDHLALTTGANSVTNAIKDDQQTVLEQSGRIKELKADIDEWSKELLWAELGTVGGIVIALIGIGVAVFTFGLGVAVIAVGVAGTIAAATGWGILQHNINQAAVDIQTANNTISEENRQIVVLNGIADSVTNLVNKNEQAAKAMAKILDDWSTIMGKMRAVIADLKGAEGDIGSILDVGDMKTTKLAWTQLMDFATIVQGGLGNIQFSPQINLPTKDPV